MEEENIYNVSSLHYAVNWNCEEEIFNNMIIEGADVNDTNNYGETPLHYAIYKQKIPIIYLLLLEGADLYKCNTFGKTPYSLVKNEIGLFEIIKPFTRASKKWRKLKKYYKICNIFKELYKNSLENIWAPGKKGYLECEKDFYHVIVND